jgi:hypothetical protein
MYERPRSIHSKKDPSSVVSGVVVCCQEEEFGRSSTEGVEEEDELPSSTGTTAGTASVQDLEFIIRTVTSFSSSKLM